jgi:hypothetical protein
VCTEPMVSIRTGKPGNATVNISVDYQPAD